MKTETLVTARSRIIMPPPPPHLCQNVSLRIA